MRHALRVVSCTALFFALTAAAFGQTSIGGGYEVTLPDGWTFERQQGRDSIVGKLVSQEGQAISFEIGVLVEGGRPRVGGGYSDHAAAVPEDKRTWFKEQTIAGRKFSVVYTAEQRLTISSAGTRKGVNFHTTAKTPGEVADALLIALSTVEKGK